MSKTFTIQKRALFFIACAILLSLLIAPFAYADDTTTPKRPFEARKEFREEAKEDRTEMHGNIKQMRMEFASTTKARRMEIKENIEERRADIASTTKARRDALKTKLEERKKDIIIKHIEHIERRMMAAIERFENLAERMASRIEKLEARGIDMTNAKALLATAQAKIAEAEDKVEDIGTALEQALQSENPREAFTTLVRPAVTAAQEALKAAHKALVETLRAIKAADPERDDNASSTPQS